MNIYILLPSGVFKNCWMSGKQCRTWSDATFLSSDLSQHCLLSLSVPLLMLNTDFFFVCVEIFMAQSTQLVMLSTVSLPNHFYWAGLVLFAVNQYCAHSFARNWQLLFLNQRRGENDHSKYFTIKSPRRNVANPAGVEHASSWSPVGHQTEPTRLAMLNTAIHFTSPPTIGVAPISLFKSTISEVGPARREVPVSAIAWHPPLQNVVDPTDTL